jgi:DNA-binding HxlR family transcriptional regulator
MSDLCYTKHSINTNLRITRDVGQAAMTNSKRPIQQTERMTVRAETKSVVCPFDKLLEILGKPHTLQILYGLYARSPMRFVEIQNEVNVQPKTLASRLLELVKLKLVERVAFNEIPPRVDYSLTQKGKELGIIFKGMNEWARKYDST